MRRQLAYRAVSCVGSRSLARRAIHSTCRLQELSPLRMPALSPTMESGTITGWKVEPGSSFSQGDILLTIETDKAEVDVEAQDDGVMGPHVMEANKGAVNVGEVIAILGEDEEEVKGAEVPEEWKSSGKDEQPSGEAQKPREKDEKIKGKGTPSGASPSKSGEDKDSASNKLHGEPKSKLPLSPAVLRLLIESGIEDSTKIKGTGLHGRLTKGDVLAHLGQVASPEGSAQGKLTPWDPFKEGREKAQGGGGAKKPQPPVDGPTLRRLIAQGLTKTAAAPFDPIGTPPAPTFADVLNSYGAAHRPPLPPSLPPSPLSSKAARKDPFRAILGI